MLEFKAVILFGMVILLLVVVVVQEIIQIPILLVVRQQCHPDLL
jgi:hypothetical protein